MELDSEFEMMSQLVDIVVPVYNAYEDLCRCVDSIRKHTQNGTYRLVLIDDASPDPRIISYFAALGAECNPSLVLLRNDQNRGFVGTANRGMSLSDIDDVLLLNSDTIVTPYWLEKISRCAASDPKIGTVTPFSNNAEICSFPDFCQNTSLDRLPEIDLIASALEQAAIPIYPDIPTAVGFCMFVRRKLLNRVGLFDAEAFGLGYGEENDLCMRASKAGFRNVLCDDAFVAHLGSRSFDTKKAALVEANMLRLVTKHPEYPQLVRSFIQADSLRPIRDVAKSFLRIATRNSSGILHIMHGLKGGTESHVRDLIGADGPRFRHYMLIVTDDRWRLEEGGDSSVVFEILRHKDEPWADLLNAVCDTFRIDLCHVHHISGSRDGLLRALEALRRPYGLTLHDFYLACPTFTLLGTSGEYCGAVTDHRACQACLDAQSSFKGISIADWRESHGRLVTQARFVLAPSDWLADIFRRYFPGIPVLVVPHGIETTILERKGDACSAMLLPRDGLEHVGVIGAIGPVKGARRLERLVARTRDRKLPLRWVVVGHVDTQYLPFQDRDRCLTIHGQYRPEHLGALLDHYGIRLAVFPSAGPESFSYTLSEVWALGRLALVPPIGALGERMRRSGAGWLMEDWRNEDRILDQILEICAPSNAGEFEQRSLAVRTMDVSSRDAMSTMTEDIYATSLADVASHIAAGTGLEKRRLYQSVVAAQGAGGTTKSGGLVEMAFRYLLNRSLRIRYTSLGRWLYRAYKATPSGWQRALRRHLQPFS